VKKNGGIIVETVGIKTIYDSKMIVDEEGRICLPQRLREQMGIYTGDQFEVVIIDGRITLARSNPTCFVCDDDDDVEKVHRTFLCRECRETLSEGLETKHFGGSESGQSEVVKGKIGLRLI